MSAAPATVPPRRKARKDGGWGNPIVYQFRGRGAMYALGVQAFASQYSVDTAKVLAFTSLSIIPALLFFSLFERRIAGGLTGAVKG